MKTNFPIKIKYPTFFSTTSTLYVKYMYEFHHYSHFFYFFVLILHPLNLNVQFKYFIHIIMSKYFNIYQDKRESKPYTKKNNEK